jgi:hypothetical protein
MCMVAHCRLRSSGFFAQACRRIATAVGVMLCTDSSA